MLRGLILMWEAVIVRPFIRSTYSSWTRTRRGDYYLDYIFDGDEWRVIVRCAPVNFIVEASYKIPNDKTIGEVWDVVHTYAHEVINSHIRLRITGSKWKSCSGCTFYSGNDYLPCAVHPSGPITDPCSDYEVKNA